MAKKVQLAHAVPELHGCGTVHGGTAPRLLTAPDLHLSAVLFSIREVESRTADGGIRDCLCGPRKIATTNLRIPPPPDSNVPKYVVCTPVVSNLVPLCLEPAIVKIMQGNSMTGKGTARHSTTNPLDALTIAMILA